MALANRNLSRVDRLTRLATRIIAADIFVSILMGSLIVLAWEVFPNSQLLLDLSGGPGGGRGIPATGFLFATLLSFPVLGVCTMELLHGQWSGLKRLLTFIGPMVIFLSFTYLPHDLLTCSEGAAGIHQGGVVAIWGDICRIVVAEPRWHLLFHSLCPAIFMVAIYWVSLRKWYPSLIGKG